MMETTMESRTAIKMKDPIMEMLMEIKIEVGITEF